MKKRRVQSFRLLTGLLILFSFSIAKAQVLDSTLAVYSTKYQQERTYLHYDKTAYVPGETIWFKAYLMQGILPAEGSKTFYIDWVDDKGKLLNHSSAPVLDEVLPTASLKFPKIIMEVLYMCGPIPNGCSILTVHFYTEKIFASSKKMLYRPRHCQH
jgi:hypothetical protein